MIKELFVQYDDKDKFQPNFPNMVLIITQETFDASVKENIDDLGMQPEEALQETIIQFEKQVSKYIWVICMFLNYLCFVGC